MSSSVPGFAFSQAAFWSSVDRSSGLTPPARSGRVRPTCRRTTGRTMSRTQAKRHVWGETLIQDMAQRASSRASASKSGAAEEAGFAYQDLAAVVDTLRRLDLSRPVVSLTPIGNIKG